MRNTLANLWHPLTGVQIHDLGQERFLFKFYSEVDIDRVLEGGPWMFNNHMLIAHRLLDGEDPLEVRLDLADFWVKVHELPPGLMNEKMAVKLGDFLGAFVKYDTKHLVVADGKPKVMKLRACIDVNEPLKRKKKLCLANGKEVYAKFKYDRLPTFCFLCGRLGHAENFCKVRLVKGGGKDLPLQWDLSLRAERRGAAVMKPSKWLRGEGGSSGSFFPQVRVAANQDPMVLGQTEESPLEVVEANKRRRSGDNSHNNVSKNNLSAGLDVQARREQ